VNWDPETRLDNVPEECPGSQVKQTVNYQDQVILHQQPSENMVSIGIIQPIRHLLDGTARDQSRRVHFTTVSKKLSHMSCKIPDVVRSTLKKVFPISCFPKSETFHFDIIVAHGCISVRRAVEVKVDEFLQVCSNDLVGIDKNDLLQIHREENIEEQNFISPDDALFLLLSPKPRWPLVGDQFVLEVVSFCHVWNEFLLRHIIM
jgi:hypothetical protein